MILKYRFISAYYIHRHFLFTYKQEMYQPHWMLHTSITSQDGIGFIGCLFTCSSVSNKTIRKESSGKWVTKKLLIRSQICSIEFVQIIGSLKYIWEILPSRDTDSTWVLTIIFPTVAISLAYIY